MRKAIVTGPTGVIGTAVINKLIDEGCKIYAVIRKESKRIANILLIPMFTLFIVIFLNCRH